MIMLRDGARRGDGAPDFAPGDLVRHRRYGYRGVVVSVDERCRADDAWYQNNQTQPDREQPWYHVLVHGSVQSTYPAQTSLEPDPSREPIQHPLIDQLFSAFADGRYLRNDRPFE